MKKINYLLILVLLLSCVQSPKKKTVVKQEAIVKNKNQNKKQKVGKNTYEQAIKRTTKFANELDFNLDYIRKKGLADKKFLAEFLGMYLKLQKSATTAQEKEVIYKRIEPYYKKTLESSFHNMAKVDDKLFKKNSMSYMRIMWLLKEMGFDITEYKQELAKVQKRMDNHMPRRGEWQRAVFDKYYDYFKIKKPVVLQNAKRLKGPITTRKPLEFYKRTKAYVLTHFLFAAYDYGNKKTQTRFSKADIEYIKTIVPQIIKKFELKQNDDIVAELLTCLIFIEETETNEFKASYKRLINRQNIDGSFGSYERSRKKIGSDVEFRQYMHTTLVALETLVEFEDRK